MKIMDAHCDVLLKLFEDPSLSFYAKSKECQVSYDYMVKSNVVIQVFALFVPPDIPSSQRFDYVLRMIDIYYEKVVKHGYLTPISQSKEMDPFFLQNAKGRAGILSLEGADALEGNITYLRTLYRLGVRAMGFTWNHRNEAADGVEEPSPGGLSKFGREVLKEANRLGILLDVSHLSEPGFWDVVELSQAPIIASHSNCKEVLNHKRNLSDEQLRAIYKMNGVLGLTFVPHFISSGDSIHINDLLRHLEHALVLGGENHLAFGSDFDGIKVTMEDLQNTACYSVLVETLLKHYKEEQVGKWMHGNWLRVFKYVLG
jgi:membrane dipeptidase